MNHPSITYGCGHPVRVEDPELTLDPDYWLKYTCPACLAKTGQMRVTYPPQTPTLRPITTTEEAPFTPAPKTLTATLTQPMTPAACALLDELAAQLHNDIISTEAPPAGHLRVLVQLGVLYLEELQRLGLLPAFALISAGEVIDTLRNEIVKAWSNGGGVR